MIYSIVLLVTLHCLADYPLQGDFLANFKGKNRFLLFIHSFIWAGMIYMGLHHLGFANETWHFPFLLGAHYLIDDWKCKRPDKSKALTTDLYIDQALHMVQIGVCLLA